MSARVLIYYQTDLNDSQWKLIEPLLPEARSGSQRGGRPARDRREIVNALLDVVKTGCPWRSSSNASTKSLWRR
jgi:transposase